MTEWNNTIDVDPPAPDELADAAGDDLERGVMAHPLEIANQHGNFDLLHNKLPRGYVHVRGRVHAAAKKLKLKYVPAVVDFRTSRYGASPVTDGIVCTERAAKKLDEALRPKRDRERRKRISEELENLCEGLSSACTAAVLYPTPESALPAACETLFGLNRYAKISARHRTIYAAKNKLIRKLVEMGYLVGAGEHSVTLDAQECYSCDGDGCERCDGSGYWRDAVVQRYHVLRFLVGDKTYTWHQPTESVGYALPTVPTLEDGGDWDPREAKTVPGIGDVNAAIAIVTYAATVPAPGAAEFPMLVESGEQGRVEHIAALQDTPRR